MLFVGKKRIHLANKFHLDSSFLDSYCLICSDVLERKEKKSQDTLEELHLIGAFKIPI